MYDSERVWHVHVLEVFSPGASYGSLSERIAGLLGTRSLKDNTRVLLVATTAQREALRVAFGKIAGVRPHPVIYEPDGLRAALLTIQVGLQQSRIGFAPGLPMRERLQQELLGLGAHEVLEVGVNPGALASALVAGCWWSGGGDPRALADDPARDKITPLDLRPAPEPMFSVRSK
jgi:hypothetical protein